MSAIGFISLHRPLLENPIIDDESALRLWVILLLKANYTDQTFRGRVIRRGQLAFATRIFAERWNISRGKLQRVLKKLQKLEAITVEASREYTVVTVVNYNSYQDPKQGDRSTDGTTDGTTDRATDGTTNRARVNKVNKGNNITNSSYEELASAEADAPKPKKKKKKPETLPMEIEPFVDRWNVRAKEKGLAVVLKLSPARRAKLRKRLLEKGWFDAFCIAMAQHLPVWNEPPRFTWQPDFDWIVNNAENVFKLTEGKYDEPAEFEEPKPMSPAELLARDLEGKDE